MRDPRHPDQRPVAAATAIDPRRKTDSVSGARSSRNRDTHSEAQPCNGRAPNPNPEIHPDTDPCNGPNPNPNTFPNLSGSPPFAYAALQVISNFTFLRGASHPEELVAEAHALGYRALALTDECSLAGVVRAHSAATELGLKLIVGAQFVLEDGLTLVLLASDKAAYSALSMLVTRTRRRCPKGAYALDRAGLAALKTCPGAAGLLAVWIPNRQYPCAEELGYLHALFAERLWIGVSVLLDGFDAQHLTSTAALSDATAVPRVAVNDVHMHSWRRRPLQDALTAIRHSTTIADSHALRFPNGERHLRPLERLAKLYPQTLLDETMRLAERCHFSLGELRYSYPHELVPAGRTATEYLAELTRHGLKRRYPHGTPQKVQAQVKMELGLIAEMGYEAFFLTVHDLVWFARGRGILCQGRGSAANSAVCYALGITEVDPARMSMLFERFISKERNQPPDIDVDFEHQRREEVVQYIYRKYGRDRAALAATVITYRQKSAIRDVGKALGMSLAQIDALTRNLYWFDGQTAVAERLETLGFDPDNPQIHALTELVAELQRFPRHLSQHVGGFVISDAPLGELVPIENASMPERTVIQWDKDDLETLGLLKVDCLCLGMLTALRRSFDLLAGYDGRQLTLADIPAEDPTTYGMIQRADTIGVFQIESRAQMAMLPRLKPACYYDLVIEIAIIRPGPIQGDMVHPYLRRRNGEEPVTYPSEEVRGILERTLGVPLFQEQIIKLAMVAAGFSGGEADALRRSMATFKRTGGVGGFRERLLTGMRQRGYRPEFAEQVCDQIEGFGEYGFPESHSASFALLAYVSAWLKCHEPAAFCAALINSAPMGFYAPAQLIADARRHGVEVRPVDVRFSDYDCTLEPGSRRNELGRLDRANPVARDPRIPIPTLRLGLRLVKGLSEDAARRICTARQAAPFTDVSDLAARADLNRAELKVLAGADALRGLAGNRRQAGWAALGVEGPMALFDAPRFVEATPMLSPLHEAGEVVADYRTIGLSLRRHPLALLRPMFDRRGLITARGLGDIAHGTPVLSAGLVINRQRPGTASGVVFATLEDETGHINLVIWSSLFDAQRGVALGAQLLGVEGVLEREGAVMHVVARRLFDGTRWLGALDVRSRDFH